MSTQYIFTMYKLSRVHPPDKRVLEDISLSFLPGAKIGVLGANGSGKSTLLRIMAGVDTEFRGDAQLAPGASVGLLEQEPQLDPSKDVKGNVEDGVRELRDMLDRFNELAANYSDETADEFARLQDAIDAADAWNLDTTLEIAMDALRLPPGDADVETLSGGERRRVALCRLLLSAPDLLLLDEPTNHLDAESVAWLEKHLEDYKGTVVAVTHDRYFLDNVAGWILELDRGRGIPFKGNYSSWLEQKQERLAQEERRETARRRTIARELEWVRESPKGRRTKARARLNRYEALLAEEKNVKLDQVQIHIPAGPRLGDVVVEADDLRKGFGDRLLIDDLSFTLPPAGIVGVIGPNGAGKTTLFRMIVGEEEPDAGELRLGESVELAYVDQSRDALDPDKTVWEEISDGYDNIKVGEREMNSRAYCAGFNFRGSDQQRKVGALSGGERNRVHLAKLLRRGGNLLLLDEPTNDLDVDTLRALEEALLVVRRLRRDHLARPLVPRPRGDPRARLRGRLAGRLVRGQLRGLRGEPPRPPRRRGGPPAPDHLQEADPDLSDLELGRRSGHESGMATRHDDIDVRGVPVERHQEVLTSEALELVGRLHEELDDTRRALLDARRQRQAELDAGGTLDFVTAPEDFTVAPVPDALQDRRVEITGPTSRKMVINALNSGARGFMADFEDANSPTWREHGRRPGQPRRRRARLDGARGEGQAVPARRGARRAARAPARAAPARAPPARERRHAWPARSWTSACTCTATRTSCSSAAAAPTSTSRSSSRTARRALWRDAFVIAEEALGLDRGTIKATVLIETIPAAFEMDAILYELRDHAAGLNAGRWDYIFSTIKRFRSRPDFVLPDRSAVTMTVPFMHAYSQLVVKTCHARGAHAMGGMSAVIPSRTDEEANRKAFEAVRADKEREAGEGFDGTWVAHPDSVPVATEAFDEVLGDRPNQVDKQRDDVTAERRRRCSRCPTRPARSPRRACART